jgi:hypothetical protein
MYVFVCMCVSTVATWGVNNCRTVWMAIHDHSVGNIPLGTKSNLKYI